jgi:hypothetical protein
VYSCCEKLVELAKRFGFNTGGYGSSADKRTILRRCDQDMQLGARSRGEISQRLDRCIAQMTLTRFRNHSLFVLVPRSLSFSINPV